MKVTLQNPTKKYPAQGKKQSADVVAVNDFTFAIPDGQLISLSGPSGCGKSTTLSLLSGLQKPAGGKIFFGEDGVTDLPAENRDISVVPTRPNSQNVSIRAIISAENLSGVRGSTVRFDRKPGKVFTFLKETGERIYF